MPLLRRRREQAGAERLREHETIADRRVGVAENALRVRRVR